MHTVVATPLMTMPAEVDMMQLSLGSLGALGSEPPLAGRAGLLFMLEHCGRQTAW